MLKSEGLWDSKNKLAENVIKNAARFNASTDSVISKFNEEYVVINKNTFAYRALTAEETELILSGKKYTLNVEGQIVAQKGLNATLFESIAAFARAGLIARTFGLTLEGVSIAARAAQVAVATLEAVLTAGIWLVVGLAIQYVYEKLSKFFDKTKDAKDGTEAYTRALEKNSEALNKNLQEIEYQIKKKTLLAQIAGKTADDVLKITQEGLDKEKDLYSKQIGQLQAIRAKASKDTKLTAEERRKVLDDIDKKIVEAANNYVKKREDIEVAGLERKKEIADKQREDQKTADQILIDLQNDFKKNTTKNAREKEDVELKIAYEAEEKKIKLLQISDAKKLELLKELNAKYVAIIFQTAKKRNEEDEKTAEENAKKVRDFLNKENELKIAAIKNQYQREDAEREKNKQKELQDLEDDVVFKKLSEQRKQEVRQEVIQKYAVLEENQKRDRQIASNNQEITLLQAQQKNLLNGTQAFFDNENAIEELAYQTKILNAQKNGEDLEKIEKEHQANLKNIALQQYIAEKELAIARMQVIGSIGNSLQQLAGKNKALAITGIVIEKAASIGEIIANTGIANAKAVAASPLTFGQPWVTINTIAGALSIAASIKGAADAIGQINAANTSGSSTQSNAPGKNYAQGGMIYGPDHSQGGVNINAQGGEAVMTRSAVSMFRPLLSVMNQMGGGTSFQRGMVGQAGFDAPKRVEPTQENIIKTYVVESDLTTIQHKNARLKELSTI